MWWLSGEEMASLAPSVNRLWGPAGANFEYAKAHKWQAGVRAIWAGAGLSAALGIAWVPRSKIVTAVAKLARAAKGEAAREEWRSMMGLLEHVRGVAGINKETHTERALGYAQQQ